MYIKCWGTYKSSSGKRWSTLLHLWSLGLDSYLIMQPEKKALLRERWTALEVSFFFYLLLSLNAPVAEELHEYLSKTKSASLALCLLHAQCLIARLACHCVLLQVLICFFGLDETDMLLCASFLPFLSSLPLLSVPPYVLISGSAGLQSGSWQWLAVQQLLQTCLCSCRAPGFGWG